MASSSSVSQEKPSINSFHVVVSRKLLALLQPVKKISSVTTFSEVLDGLRIYISEKKLYDSQDPVRIRCSGDQLNSVLGVEEFTIYDVRNLLQKLVLPVRINKNNSIEMQVTPAAVCDNAGKRKAEESQEGESFKRTCDEQSKDPMYLFIPPSPAKGESSSESHDSVQGYETAFVKDSTDDSMSFFDESDGEDFLPGDIVAVEETFDVEYEIESDSDEETQIHISDSGSDSEVVGNTVLTFVCKSDSDQEFWADKSSDEELNSDLEILESDKWKCKRCGSFNNPPMRYCGKCWDMRSGWVVPKRNEYRERPRRKPRSKRNNQRLKKPIDALREESSSSPKPATSSSSSSAQELSNISLSSANSIHKFTIADPCLQLLASASSDVCSSSTDLQSPSSNSMQEMLTTSSVHEAPFFSSLPELSTFNSMQEFSPSDCLLENQSSKTFQEFPFTSLAPNKNQKEFCNLSSDVESSSQEPSSLSSNSSSQEFPSPYSSSQEFPIQDFPSTSKEIINSLSNFRTLNLSNVPKCEAEAKLCLLCCAKPANASIIHGKYAHQISCYRCAKKLKQENKRCPVCRRTIDRVVHQITAL